MEGDSMRFAAFDIEATNLNATYGRILCACFKFFDEDKVRTKYAHRYKDEVKLLEWIYKQVDEADVLVTWYGKLYDIPMVNGRLLMRRDEVKNTPHILPDVKHIDLYWQSKKLKTLGNRMDGAARDLKCDNQKFNVNAEHWVKAADGNKDSLGLIVKHCEVDVLMTEELCGVLKPHIVRITK